MRTVFVGEELYHVRIRPITSSNESTSVQLRIKSSHEPVPKRIIWPVHGSLLLLHVCTSPTASYSCCYYLSRHLWPISRHTEDESGPRLFSNFEMGARRVIVPPERSLALSGPSFRRQKYKAGTPSELTISPDHISCSLPPSCATS